MIDLYGQCAQVTITSGSGVRPAENRLSTCTADLDPSLTSPLSAGEMAPSYSVQETGSFLIASADSFLVEVCNKFPQCLRELFFWGKIFQFTTGMVSKPVAISKFCFSCDSEDQLHLLRPIKLNLIGYSALFEHFCSLHISAQFVHKQVFTQRGSVIL